MKMFTEIETAKLKFHLTNQMNFKMEMCGQLQAP